MLIPVDSNSLIYLTVLESTGCKHIIDSKETPQKRKYEQKKTN